MSRRWPRWIYGVGDEPDYQFTFANERTFLAWVRTALALVAAGVAIDVIEPPWSEVITEILAIGLLLLGLVCSAAAFLHWAMSERAIRRGAALPSAWVAIVLGAGMVLLGTLLLVARFL